MSVCSLALETLKIKKKCLKMLQKGHVLSFLLLFFFFFVLFSFSLSSLSGSSNSFLLCQAVRIIIVGNVSTRTINGVTRRQTWKQQINRLWLQQYLTSVNHDEPVHLSMLRFLAFKMSEKSAPTWLLHHPAVSVSTDKYKPSYINKSVSFSPVRWEIMQ